MDEALGCYVLKLNKDDGRDVDLSHVLKATESYLQLKYPVTNFIFLGLLLLTNNRKTEKFLDTAFYHFVLETYLALMKVLNKEFFSKKSMTCSEYVTQCFTDGGEESNISFKDLYIRVDGLKSSNGEDSLLDMLNPEDSLDEDLSDTTANKDSLFSMEEITTQFVKWADDDTESDLGGSVVSDFLLKRAGTLY